MAELIVSVRAWFCRYILFYLRTVANEENISLIYYIAQRAKQFRDKLSPENSDVRTPFCSQDSAHAKPDRTFTTSPNCRKL
jgi:hypothetical protein